MENTESTKKGGLLSRAAQWTVSTTCNVASQVASSAATGAVVGLAKGTGKVASNTASSLICKARSKHLNRMKPSELSRLIHEIDCKVVNLNLEIRLHQKEIAEALSPGINGNWKAADKAAQTIILLEKKQREVLILQERREDLKDRLEVFLSILQKYVPAPTQEEDPKVTPTPESK